MTNLLLSLMNPIDFDNLLEPRPVEFRKYIDQNMP